MTNGKPSLNFFCPAVNTQLPTAQVFLSAEIASFRVDNTCLSYIEELQKGQKISSKKNSSISDENKFDRFSQCGQLIEEVDGFNGNVNKSGPCGAGRPSTPATGCRAASILRRRSDPSHLPRVDATSSPIPIPQPYASGTSHVSPATSNANSFSGMLCSFHVLENCIY